MIIQTDGTLPLVQSGYYIAVISVLVAMTVVWMFSAHRRGRPLRNGRLPTWANLIPFGLLVLACGGVAGVGTLVILNYFIPG